MGNCNHEDGLSASQNPSFRPDAPVGESCNHFRKGVAFLVLGHYISCGYIGNLMDSNLEHIFDDAYWMEQALSEAEGAMEAGEVPVGAILVHGNEVIGRGRNQVEALQDPTAHAEMIAITSSVEALKSRRLTDTTLYVTLEPCPMCAGAIVLARIGRLVYGAWDPKAGACGTLMNLLAEPRLNHQPEVVGGVLADRCGEILSHFFQRLRASEPPGKRPPGTG